MLHIMQIFRNSESLFTFAKQLIGFEHKCIPVAAYRDDNMHVF